jgi:hypothetical protein
MLGEVSQVQMANFNINQSKTSSLTLFSSLSAFFLPVQGYLVVTENL